MIEKEPNLVIPFALPTLNEMVNTAKSRFGQTMYNNMKKKYTKDCRVFVVRMNTINTPAVYEFHWYRENKRHNPDNIAAGGEKIVFDALQTFNKLRNDNWEWVRGIDHRFFVDKKKPRCELFLHYVSDN